MIGKPFLLEISRLVPEKQPEMYYRDAPPTEDPLPTPVDLAPGGYVLSTDTQITATRGETTDDK